MINKDKTKIKEIKALHLEAFGTEEGPVIFKLVEDFLLREDSIAISVEEGCKIIGNVIFSPFILEEYPEKKFFLLAPLGVLSEYQRKGVGKKLIEESIGYLKSLGGEAIFVLGDPNYYPLRGFKLTTIKTPYSEIMRLPEAWMALEIEEGALKGLHGNSVASKPIMKPMFWDTTGRG